MSDAPQPFGPFGGFDFNQMLRFLQVEGPVHWEVAGQVARWVAVRGQEEGPISPADRTRLLEVAAAAEAHVLGEMDEPPPRQVPEVLGRAEWAGLALTSLRPVLERLAVTLQGPAADDPEAAASNPLAGMLGALGPLLLGVQCGFMVGQLGQGVLSQHDFLLPVEESPRPALVVPNMEEFHGAWSVPADDLRFFVAMGESVRSRVCARPWVRQRLLSLSRQYVSSFRVDPEALESQLGTLDLSDPSSLESLVGNPDVVLGAMTSPEQRSVLERLQHTTAVFESFADHVVERLSAPLLPSLGTIKEAMRRHRIERSEADRFVQRLLGLDPSRRAHDTAAAFCAGVVERAGHEGLNRLLDGEEFMPTTSELEAPGLWLARLEIHEG